ncbi:MAG: PSD1 and planctomycete cytochrome C domain-containing protein [Limisphaerales bacterium]
MQPGLIPLVALALAAAGGLRAAADDIRFNRDIRPILSDTCYQCHGPDKAQRKAKLRLDVRDDAVSHGAIVPGRPDESGLVKRLFSDDPEELMPPPELHKALTAGQKELLKRWIASGAPYEAHWAYTPLERPVVPRRGNLGRRKSEIETPIDAFVRAGLDKAGLAPSPEADRRTLLRRLSLDLTGLPPTPAEVGAFVKDRSPRAYEKQVERLLGSPHYGERMAVPWLDAVRFADTVGYHGDQNQRIFPYRDWVVAAFNDNKPFDEFTIEQVAGDLLPNPTPAQLTASGFNRLNMMTREGGAQPKEYLAKYQGDRVRTVSTAWLGSTMTCAECHDHKYDPFTTRDFYELAAFFGDVRQWGVYADYHYTPEPELRGIGNDHPFPPEIEVKSPYLKARMARLESEASRILAEQAGAVDRDKARRAEFAAWRGEAAGFLARNPDGWQLVVGAAVISGEGTNAAPAVIIPQTDGSILFATTNATTDRIEIALEPGWIAALRVELLPAAEHGGDIARGDRKDFTVELSARLKPAAGGDTKGVGFWWADADKKELRFAHTQDILGVQDGWRTGKSGAGGRQSAVWLLDQPFRAAGGDVLVVTLKNSAAARVRLATSPFAFEPAHAAEEAALLAGGLNRRAARALVDRLHLAVAGGEARQEWRRLHRGIAECRDGKAWTMVTQSTTNRLVTRVLPRGNWMDESGPVVQPATPHFLPPPRAGGAQRADVAGAREGRGDAAPSAAASPLTRLDLAQWLVAPENPLTPRNIMNRQWAQLFGAGISGRVEDLGLQGEWPTNPGLLDWLASEFRDSGWDLKHMVRLIVMSETYRQDSVPSVRAREVDPQNKLLSHQSPRRLDAEFVRDNALSAAGLISLEVGGPSVFPYQPAGYYANLQFPDRDYHASPDERQYRRGVYMHWQRTFLQPMLANFDAPSREECIAGRLLSNTPQQALTLLNDPTFVEAARVLAARLLQDGKNDAQRIVLAYERALARSPEPAERDGLLALLERQREHYRGNEAETQALFTNGLAPLPAGLDPAELAAWTQVCRVILNLHETITRY